MLADLRDRTAIVGVGTTAFGARYRDLDPELTAYELAGLLGYSAEEIGRLEAAGVIGYAPAGAAEPVVARRPTD